MKILVIIGTTRQGRFSERPAKWMYGELKTRKDINAELVDLRDYPLPFFDDPVNPSRFEAEKHVYTNEIARRWQKKIADADGYVIVTAEYNHGYPAVLKNAIDYLFSEWKNKTVGFVSYGSVSGARAVEQLREVAIELSMLPIRNSIHIPVDVVRSVKTASDASDPALFRALREGPVDKVELFLNDLISHTKAMKMYRESK